MDITIVFPHQLFATSKALKKSRRVFIIRDPLFINDPKYKVNFHKNKILLHLLSTEKYKEELISKGYDAILIDSKDLVGENYLESLFKINKISEIHYCDPVDYVLNKRIHSSASNLNIRLYKYDTPGFMLNDDDVKNDFSNKKSHFMSAFYKKQRSRFNILLNEDGSPFGGKWSFDNENRKRFPKTMSPPKIPSIHYRSEYLLKTKDYVSSTYQNNPGSMDTFNYPVTRQQAFSSFHAFLDERLVNFGSYEDAIVKNESTLFHSIITPYLNIGLITPSEIIEETLSFASENTIPINSLEGFIRQIIGWREFMRGIYVADGVKQRNSNFWNYDKHMPDAFYNATTGIEPLDDTIKKCLDTGYAHHIERLMIVGNLMLLIGIRPNSVYKWFMEIFIDSYDWVMVPNVYGMSQFADGGLLATKPYISGSNYILKMSDYKKGDWCLIWDSLYWGFVDRNRDFFRKNPRMSMMVSMFDKKDNDSKKRLYETAESFIETLF